MLRGRLPSCPGAVSQPRGPAAKTGVATTLIALLLVAAALISGTAQGRGTSSRQAIAARTFARHAVVIGHSVRGRALRVVRIGDPRAPRHVLIAACIHGDEPAGIAITRALRSASIPQGVSVWVLDQANPDGCAASTRANAHQVDLNRNSPWYWRRFSSPGGSSTRVRGRGQSPSRAPSTASSCVCTRR